MSNDLLIQAKARVTSAQNELDQALLAGADTTQAREYLTSTQAEVARIEAAMASETARIEADASKDLESRAAELMAKGKAQLLAEFQALGFDSLPEFEIPSGAAISYVRASDLANAELANEQQHREASHKLQARINDLTQQMQAITARRLDGDERDSYAAQFALLRADCDAAKDLLNRLVRPEATTAALWADDARKLWEAAVGAARVRILETLTHQAEARLIAIARVRLTPVGGVFASRYFPSVQMRRALEGRF